MNIRAFFSHTLTHTHIFICAFEADALCEHIWCEADLEGVLLLCPREQMSLALTQYFLSFSLSINCIAVSLPLSLPPCMCFSRSPSFFFLLRPDGEKLLSKPLSPRITMLQVMWSGLLSPPYLFLSLCLCLSISASAPSFPVSFPPWQRQTKAFHFSLACLRAVCLYCTKLGSLSHCIPSFSLQRRCLGAPGPLLWDRGPASARWGRWQWRVGRVCVVSEGERGGRKSRSEYIISFSALELGRDCGVKPCSSVCDKGTTSHNLGTIHTSRCFHLIQGVCESSQSPALTGSLRPLSFLVRARWTEEKVARMMAGRDGGGGREGKVTGLAGAG